MSQRTHFIDASRIDWYSEQEGKYPGDTKVIIGCLQRIADAMEAMAKNYNDLMAENKRLAESRAQLSGRVDKLQLKVRSMKGAYTKLKNKK